jgi:DNA-binding response OmpR family regulator
MVAVTSDRRVLAATRRSAYRPAVGSASGTAHPSTGRILLVEDDPAVLEVTRDHLERDGFRVLAAADGATALDVLASEPLDLVVLDLRIPGFEGFDVLAAVRRLSDVPVVVVTGRSDELDRVVGLEMGADDYVVKPFSTRELSARVRSVLRRARPQREHDELTFDGMVIDPATREVVVDGNLIPMTGREFDLLHFLASSPRQVFSRAQLLRHVWSSSPDWQDAATVTEYIHRLRGKIEADPHQPRWITTVWGVGYRFEG